MGLMKKAKAKAPYATFDKATLVASTMAARYLLKKVWKAFSSKDEVAENPSSPTVNWRDALIWGAVSGIVLNLARVTAQRLATGWWREHKA